MKHFHTWIGALLLFAACKGPQTPVLPMPEFTGFNTEVTADAAVITVSHKGDYGIVEAGIYLGADKRIKADALDPGQFTVSVSGLEPSTTYTYKAFISSGLQEVTSQEQTFTTAAAPKVVATGNGAYTIWTENTSLQEILPKWDIDLADIKHLKVVGTLAKDDFPYIRNQMKELKSIDLRETALTVLPNQAFAFSGIESVELPDGLEEIGRGGGGIVYRIDDETIIKVFREGTSLDEVKREITMAKEAFVLGMSTAISFDCVQVGNQYGLIYELLKAHTLSTIVGREPEKVDDFARLYANMFRHLHSIEVPSYSPIPNAAQQEEQSIRTLERYFDTASIDILLQIAGNIPNANRLLHCDLQSKNILMQGSEPMLIDMGEVCSGHPLMDLGHSYSAMVELVGDYESVIGLPKPLGSDLWMRMANYYFEGLSPAEIAHRLEQINVVSRVRNFSWLSLSDSFPEEVIRECQELFVVKVLNQKEKLLDISKTFNDWPL